VVGRLIRKDLEGYGCGLIEVLSRNFPGWGTEKPRKIFVRIYDVPAETRSDL
jgi:hypothetical protein